VEDFIEKVIDVHRLVGNFNIFVVAPMAMLSFARTETHRRWGKLYFFLMIFLYATGLSRTVFGVSRALLEGSMPSPNSWRSLSFNFFGFSLVFYGYRAIYVMYTGKYEKPTVLDWSMTGLLALSSLALIRVAFLMIDKFLPLLVFGVLGLILTAVEISELMHEFTKKSVLFARHMRYMLASYFYVITVFSVVHDFVPGKTKWLWPTVAALPVIFLTTRASAKVLGRNHRRTLNWAIRVSILWPYVIGLTVFLRD
jgi:hypothetical protein